MRSLAGVAAMLIGLAAMAGCAGGEGAELRQDAAPPGTASGNAAAAEFARVRDNPVELRMFLQRFPKGGDLHNHLSGAVYAEDFVDWALADGTCLDLESMVASTPPCDPKAGRPALAAALAEGRTSRGAVIDAWSMRNYVPGISAASGHQQFFRSFPRFDAAEDGRDGEALAAAVGNAAEQEILYLELMVSPQMWPARGLALELGLKPAAGGDWTPLYDRLLPGIGEMVPKARAKLDRMEAELRRRYGCDGPAPRHAACDVEVRYLAQVIRTVPPEQIFPQNLLAFLLVEADPRFVGLNLVAPEDDNITLTTYTTQMEQLRWLAERRGPVPVTLHAGELTLGLVPPEDLRFHIREAIEIAGASRIGHGVDIAYERDADGLLRRMAAQPVPVEINLTSNATILGVEGRDHPFQTYRAYGVPLTLSTDDEGVSRIDLTHEYQRAVQTYDLGYDDILAFSRNALTYAFLPGDSLWAEPARAVPADPCAGTAPPGHAPPAPACAAFLAGSEKARLQWRLEEKLAAFEAERAALRRARGL